MKLKVLALNGTLKSSSSTETSSTARLLDLIAEEFKSFDAVNEWLLSFGIEFNFFPHLIALLVAYLPALPIGWDREQNERSAGLRTFPLVAIAAYGFIQASEKITLGNAEATARALEGLINGVGFI